MTGNLYYSGAGDAGETSLISSGRYSKSAQIFEVLGTLDELNAFIALALTEDKSSNESEILQKIYDSISNLMAEIAGGNIWNPIFTCEQIAWIEQIIAGGLNAGTSPAGFLKPGKNRLAAVFNILRVITRRAEREVVRYYEQEPEKKNPGILTYLNRVSSLFFAMMHHALDDQD